MRTWFFGPGSWLTRLAMRFLGPLRYQGLERVPREGAFILVSNHISLLDPMIIGGTAGHLTGRLVHFMAKEEIRHWPLIGWLANQAGVYFVRRGESDRAAQRLSLDLLARGEPIAVFPEGTRSRDGSLGEPRDGAALLAMRAGVPVIDLRLVCTDAADYSRSSPIEPSVVGGGKIARVVARLTWWIWAGQQCVLDVDDVE